MMNEDWRKEALCLKRHIDFWFPPMDADVPENYYAVAREVCRRCPVWKDCLNDAMKPPVEAWGMWGGLTPQERTVINNSTPKPTAVRPHGSWLRYRQGCDCEACQHAHNDEVTHVNMSVIPYMHESVGDLDAIRFALLS
jgi:hypothetical protein